MTTPLLEAENVVKVLGSGAGRVEALRGVTLSLTGGELTMLMGPSGSGKTTLLSILGCMLSPTSGTVRVLGNATTGASPEQLADLRRKHVGFVFQTYHLFPTLTAEENIRIALDVCGERRAAQREKAEAALAAVGLAEKAGSFPSELSSGQQQRVAIARAIVTDPDLIVADEPTGDLDAKSAVEILTLLRELNRAFEKTIVMVTHDPRAERFVEVVIRLDKGVLVNGAAA